MSDTFSAKNNIGEYSYCRFGTDILTKLLQTMQAQTSGVEKNEDTEFVHKMRVSSRRIRAAMPLFKECFPKKSYKKWITEIKKVTQCLGLARDLDVQITVIDNYIEKLEPLEPKVGIEILLKQHTNQRANIQPKVIEGMHKLKESRVIEEILNYNKKTKKQTSNVPFNLVVVREKAFWQISTKLDEFLAMETYVHRENEKLKHHEMRIKAKWLRYTMEAFAQLYPNGLSEEIKIIKEFQDTLGEMHDCDVWIESIPKLIEDIQRQNANLQKNTNMSTESFVDLKKFVDNIKTKKKDFYQKFVALWDEKKNQNIFETLRKTASAGFAAGSQRTQAELSNPYVKIGVISDVHANLHALQAVLQDAKKRGINVFLNSGDILGFGVFPNEVIQQLYSKNTLSVIGNSDLKILDKSSRTKNSQEFNEKFTRKTLTKSFAAYLRTWPIKLELKISGKKVLITHKLSSLANDQQENDITDERLKNIASISCNDIIIFGHSHQPINEKIGKTYFLNPGSVGSPLDENPQASYAQITVNPFTIELIRVNYNVEAAANALRKKGAPENFAQMLLRGCSLEKIKEEDRAKERNIKKRCPDMIRTSQSISQKYSPDTKHSEQVRKLAIQIFDGLSELHKFDSNERCWLECATILHDIGLRDGTKQHHKNSLKLILNEQQLPLTSDERQIIGNIARYHRKRCPKKTDWNLRSLNLELRQKIRVLAGILRIADGLDFSHQSLVERIETNLTSESVTIQGLVNQTPTVEEYSVNRKKDLLELYLKKNIVVAWKQLQPLQAEGETQPSPKLPPEEKG